LSSSGSSLLAGKHILAHRAPATEPVFSVYTEIMSNSVRLIAHVFGQVQGVFYRQFVTAEAQKLQLRGTVCNLPDGSVKVIAEGAEPNLLILLDLLHEGSAKARVDRVEDEWESATGEFSNFQQLC